MAHLPQGDGPVEHQVRLRGQPETLRLIIAPLPPHAVAAARKRVARRASRSGSRTQPGTRIAAGYLMLLTSLPAATTPAQRVVALYRSRWQVELGFKRLKTLGGLGALPASDPQLARTWLLAQLIGAVLTEDIAAPMVAFPPVQSRSEPPRRHASPWRAWKIAHRCVLAAILPHPVTPSLAQHPRWQQVLRQPPRQRRSQAAELRAL